MSLGGIYKGDAEPFTTQSVNPNTTFLIADSQAREIRNNPMPTEFEVEISNAAAGARRIAHRNLQWTQPLWWHNPSDWEVRISFSVDNYAQVFVGYAYPWTTFRAFAGAFEDLREFQDVEPNSYCAMIETMLRSGLRRKETPTVIHDFTGSGVPIADFGCKYSRQRGLVIYLGQENVEGPLPVLFRIEECSWLSRGHNVHGFGVQKISEAGNPIFTMEDSLYNTGVNVWFSAGAPLGAYTRFFFIASREMCRNRKITSFTNLRASGQLNSTELTVIPSLLENQGVLKNYVTDEDPTVVNLRPGDNLQTFKIALADEFGEIVQTGRLSGNPAVLYAAYLIGRNLPVPYDLYTSIYADITDNNVIYDNDVITAVLQDTYGFFSRNNFMNARIDQATPIVHHFEVTMF